MIAYLTYFVKIVKRYTDIEVYFIVAEHQVLS